MWTNIHWYFGKIKRSTFKSKKIFQKQIQYYEYNGYLMKKQDTTITQYIKHVQFCFALCCYFTVSVLASKSHLKVVAKASLGSNGRKDFVQTYLGTMQTFKDGTYK